MDALTIFYPLTDQTLKCKAEIFSTWFANFQRQQEFERNQNVKLKKNIDAMQKAAQRTSVWSERIEVSKYGNGPIDRGYIGHKSAK